MIGCLWPWKKRKKGKKGRYKKKLIREMVNFFKATFFFFCFLVHGLLLYVFAKYRRSRGSILVFLISMLGFSKKRISMMSLAHKIVHLNERFFRYCSHALKASKTSGVETVTDFLIKLGIKPRMHLDIGNKHFFNEWCHRQTY